MALTRPLGEVYFAYPEASPFVGGPSINLAQSPDAIHWKPLDQPGIRVRKGSTSSMKGGRRQPADPNGPRLVLVVPWRRDAGDRGVYRIFWALLELVLEPRPAARGREIGARGDPRANAPHRTPDVSAHNRHLRL